MSSEDSKISEICPLCGEELRFIHINLGEDAKMCTNDECLYPFVPDATDEFVPSKTKIEEGFCPSDEYVAAAKSKVEKELQERGFDWKTFDSKKFVSNMDEGACESDDSSDDSSEKEVDGDTNGVNLDEFLDSLCATPKTSVYEDPSVTKVIQSCIDSCETEANRHAVYETSIKSVMSELEETLGKIKVDSQIDIQWDADDFDTETFEMNKSRQGPGGLETAAAVEQASLQSSYDPTITTSSDASVDCVRATKESPSSSTSTTATIDGTCAQTISTSEKSNDNVKRYRDQLNHLFAKASFEKFHFPEFGKADHNTPKQMPKMYNDRLKNKNKMDPEFDTADYNLLKQMPRRYSEHVKNKNNIDPEFDNDHNISKQMPKMYSECVKNKNKLDPEFDHANHNLSKQMSRRHSECVKKNNKNNMDPEFNDTDCNMSKQMPKRHSERLKNKNKIVVSSLKKMPQ